MLAIDEKNSKSDQVSKQKVPDFCEITSSLLKFGSLSLLSRYIETAGDFIGILLIAKISPKTFAASSLIASIQRLVMTTNRMSLCGVGIMVSGEKTDNKVGQLVQQALLLSYLLSGISIPPLIFSSRILEELDQSSELALITQEYFRAYAWAIPAILMRSVGHEFILGTNNPIIALYFTTLQTCLLISSSYCLIFGKLYLPNLGITGLGYGYAFSAWTTFLSFIVFLAANKHFKKYDLFTFRLSGSSYIFKELLSYAIPMGLQIGSELLTLTASIQLVGLLDYQQLTASQISLQYVYYLSLPAFIMSQACSYFVRKLSNENNIIQGKLYGYTAITIASLFPLLGLIVFSVMPEPFINIFLNDKNIQNTDLISTTKNLLLINTTGQIIESVRNVSSGILRGFGDKKYPSLVGVSTMALSVLLGYLMGFTFNLESSGIFIARVILMAVGAAILFGKLVLLAKPIEDNFHPRIPEDSRNLKKEIPNREVHHNMRPFDLEKTNYPTIFYKHGSINNPHQATETQPLLEKKTTIIAVNHRY